MSDSVVLIIFILFSLPMVISDLKTMTVSVVVNYAGAAAVILTRLFLFGVFIESVFAAVCSFLFLFLLRCISKGGLGEGDLHYGFFCGAFLLPCKIFTGLFISSVFGISVFSLAYFARRRSAGKINEKLKLPFVPFMFAGALFSFVLKVSV